MTTTTDHSTPDLGMAAASPKRKLLVIDDDEDFAESVKDAFEGRGYLVELANSHAKALDVVKAFHAEVALIDVKLGHSSGVELIKPLRERCPEVQCIMMTGYAAMDTVIEAFRLEAVGYLHKPVALTVVRSTVDECAQRARVRRAQRAAHEALVQSERRMRRLVELHDEEFFFFSAALDGTMTYVSPAAQRVLGYMPSKMPSLWALGAGVPDNEEALRAHADVLGGKRRSYELSVRHESGAARRLRIVEAPVFDDAGAIAGVDGMAQELMPRSVSTYEADASPEVGALERAWSDLCWNHGVK